MSESNFLRIGASTLKWDKELKKSQNLIETQKEQFRKGRRIIHLISMIDGKWGLLLESFFLFNDLRVDKNFEEYPIQFVDKETAIKKGINIAEKNPQTVTFIIPKRYLSKKELKDLQLKNNVFDYTIKKIL